MWIFIPFRQIRKYWLKLNATGDIRYEVDVLIKQRDYGQEQFDKLIVYLSGGALALSVGFVKDLVGETPVEETRFLKFAWTAFAAALCLNLVSHKTSVLDADCEIRNKQGWSGFWGGITEIFNLLSLVSFVVGVACFVTFAYPKLSINEQSQNTNGRSEKRSHQTTGCHQTYPCCVTEASNTDSAKRQEVVGQGADTLTKDTANGKEADTHQ